MKTITTEATNNLQVKESWSKPEINLIGINEETLGVVPGGSDTISTS